YNHNLPGFYIAKWVSRMAAQTILRTILSLNRVSLADIQWQNFIAQTGCFNTGLRIFCRLTLLCRWQKFRRQRCRRSDPPNVENLMFGNGSLLNWQPQSQQ
ncbi:MAG: hypothetical protein KDH98_09165, partial [Calditrichaeota bacterium]|nr:hypothetical protein [Calditrichota bacterium]